MKHNKLMTWMALAACCLVALSAARGADITWTNAAGGDFSNPLNWSPNQVPYTNDKAIFNIETEEPYTVTWSASVTNDNFFAGPGKVVWNLNGHKYRLWKVTATSVYKGGLGTTTAPLDLLVTNGILDISATYPYCYYRGIVGNTTIHIKTDGPGSVGRYDNAGIGDGSKLIIDGPEMTSGRLYVLSGGELVITNGARLTEGGSRLHIRAGGRVSVSGAGSLLTGSFFYVESGVTSGILYVGDGAEAKSMLNPCRLNGGRVILDNGYVYVNSPTTRNIVIDGGMIEGNGRLAAATIQNVGGWIRPGGTGTAGLLTQTGNFHNYNPVAPYEPGTMEFNLGGTSTNAHDRLVVSGTLYAGGTLAVSLIDGFKPASGGTFDILDFTAVDGEFEELDFPGCAANWDISKLYTTGEIRYRPVGTVLMVQ